MNEINGNNKFCGPSVLSAIAGITTDEAEAIIQSIVGSTKAVRGVYYSDLKKAFHSLKFKTVDVPNISNHTVFSALYRLHRQDGTYVFMVPGHFIAIEANGNHKYICDNHTKEPINVSSSARLGMKVLFAFRVFKEAV
jgi:hypothetical protein